LKKITKEKKTIGAKRKEPHQSKKKRKHKRQRGAKKEPHQKKKERRRKKSEVLASFHVPCLLSCIIACLN
jgi:hypothetical protein